VKSKIKIKTKLIFVIDSRLIQEERAEVLLRALQDEKIKYFTDLKDQDENTQLIIFAHKNNQKKFTQFKNKLLVVDSIDEIENPACELINLNSYEEISYFLEKFFIVDKRLNLQKKIKESERFYNKVRITNAERPSSVQQHLVMKSKKDLDNLLDLEITLLSEENILNWNAHFKLFTKKNSQISQLTILKGADLLLEEIFTDEGGFIFSLPFNDLFLCLKLKSSEIVDEAFYVEIVVTMILRTIELQDQQLIKSDGEIDFWKKIFSKIPYPMAVISNLGDLLIYNESFAKIGILPKECLRFKDQESLEIFQSFYKVRRIEFSTNLINVSYFVFYTSEKFEEKVFSKSGGSGDNLKGSVDELGIISSSIAHELNNPLAGILAALSLLSLEEDWSIENLNDLDDMNNGAKRCKELVEIFLGFSKFSPVAMNAPSIKVSLDQAINLLRFRMIESNIRLEMKYIPTLERFSPQVNFSIMSMILYLIMSELMTAFAHERLITQASLTSLIGEVMELSNQVVIKFDYDFEYEEKLAQSKLIQYLLAFEKIEITFLRQEIRLIYRT